MRILNSCARIFHRDIFFPLMAEWFERKYLHCNLKIHLRNSIHEKEYFHFLYSDIDVTMAVDDVSDFLKTDCLAWFSSMKCLNPFLGEAEVYTHTEWDYVKKEKEALGLIYSDARQLRKFYWYAGASLGCLAFKRKRLVAMIKRKLKLSFNSSESDMVESVTRHLLPLIDDLQICNKANSYYHDYFKVDLIVPWDNTNSGVHVTFPAATLLACVYPLQGKGLASNNDLIDESHRRYPVLKDLQERILKLDTLEYQGSLRGKLC